MFTLRDRFWCKIPYLSDIRIEQFIVLPNANDIVRYLFF